MIDLRSDTVTQPTPEMRAAMASAAVGDDVYGEDPSILELEAMVAELLGHEAGLFCPTGSMSNLLGVWLHVRPGEEILCDAQAHIVRAELGAHAALHGITTRTWTSADGIATADQIEPLIAGDNGPFLVQTKALEIENTHNFGGGTVLGIEDWRAIAALARRYGLALHLDGARLWNAHVATGVPLAEFGREADSVSVCFSKGLGAPVGSMLLSSEDNIARARVQRKRLGGGMRQAGILAAGARYAVEHQLERLADDHRAARTLAEAVNEAAPGSVDPASVHTNIVVIRTPGSAAALCERVRGDGIIVGTAGTHVLRAVTHLGVSEAECREAGEAIGAALAAEPQA